MAIPITFEHQGKQYTGIFSQVSGSGGTGLYHLMIDDFYFGQLFHSENFGWQWGAIKTTSKGKILIQSDHHQ